MFEKKISDEDVKQIERDAKKSKKAKKREGNKKETRTAMSLKTVVIPFVLAAIVVCMIYILVQHKEDVKILKTTVVTSIGKIPANTYVEADDIDKYFSETIIDSTIVSDNTYRTLSELPTDGFYVESAMVGKQQVYCDDIAKSDEVMDKYIDGTTTTSIAVNAFDNSVSGTVRKGDIVDIFAVDPATDVLTLMAENVYVKAAYNSSGEKITEDGVATAFTILVAPNEREAVNSAIAYGGIQLYLTGK